MRHRHPIIISRGRDAYPRRILRPNPPKSTVEPSSTIRPNQTFRKHSYDIGQIPKKTRQNENICVFIIVAESTGEALKDYKSTKMIHKAHIFQFNYQLYTSVIFPISCWVGEICPTLSFSSESRFLETSGVSCMQGAVSMLFLDK